MSPDEVDGEVLTLLRRLEAAACRAPWIIQAERPGGKHVVVSDPAGTHLKIGTMYRMKQTPTNARLTAALRNYAPDLFRAVEERNRLRKVAAKSERRISALEACLRELLDCVHARGGRSGGGGAALLFFVVETDPYAKAATAARTLLAAEKREDEHAGSAHQGEAIGWPTSRNVDPVAPEHAGHRERPDGCGRASQSPKSGGEGANPACTAIPTNPEKKENE